MGFFDSLGRTFGITKSKAQGDAPALAPRKTILGTKIGKDLESLLRERISGVGTGLSKDLTDPAIASFAKRQRRDLEDITVPGISAGATARGLGRSTIPVGQVARERGRTGESIAERVANLGLTSEKMRAGQISEATGRFQRLTEAEVNSINAKVGAENAFNNAEFLRQQGFRERADAEQQKGIKMLSMAAIGAATGGMGMIPGIAGGAGGALAGAAGGLGGDFGAFRPSSGLFSGANILPGAGIPGASVELSAQEAAIDAMDLPEEEKAFLKQAITMF